jgi:hypothetical protein
MIQDEHNKKSGATGQVPSGHGGHGGHGATAAVANPGSHPGQSEGKVTGKH